MYSQFDEKIKEVMRCLKQDIPISLDHKELYAMSPAQWKQFFDILEEKQHTTLKLNHNQMWKSETKQWGAFLHGLEQNQYLDTLELERDELEKLSAQRWEQLFKAIRKNGRIKSLNFNFNAIGDMDHKQLKAFIEGLASCCHLTSVSFQSIGLSKMRYEILSAFFDALSKNKNLEFINFKYNDANKMDLEQWTAYLWGLGKIKCINSLNINCLGSDHLGLSGKAWDHVFDFLNQNPQIKELQFEYINLGRMSFERWEHCLSGLKNNKTLTSLVFSAVYLSHLSKEQHAQLFDAIKKNSGITQLHFLFTSFDNRTQVEEIIELLKDNQNIRTLTLDSDLSSNWTLEQWSTFLDFLKKNPRIELNLGGGIFIDDKSQYFKVVNRIIACSNVRSFNLHGFDFNKITYHQLRDLCASLINNKTIKILRFPSASLTGVKDSMLQVLLSAVAKMKSLQSFAIYGSTNASWIYTPLNKKLFHYFYDRLNQENNDTLTLVETSLPEIDKQFHKRLFRNYAPKALQLVGNRKSNVSLSPEITKNILSYLVQDQTTLDSLEKLAEQNQTVQLEFQLKSFLDIKTIERTPCFLFSHMSPKLSKHKFTEQDLPYNSEDCVQILQRIPTLKGLHKINLILEDTSMKAYEKLEEILELLNPNTLSNQLKSIFVHSKDMDNIYKSLVSLISRVLAYEHQLENKQQVRF